MLVFLLITGILTSPLYLLPSGSVQIYHGILALMSLMALFHTGGLKTKPVVVLVVAFWAYLIIRQTLFIMASAEADIATLLYPTLNMAVFLGVYMVLTEVATPRAIKRVLAAIAAVLVFEIGYIFIENGSLTFFMHSNIRSTGTFNNPNQLGYFALLMGCAYVAISSTLQSTKWHGAFFVSLAYLLATISLSKAAMLAIAPLLLFSLTSWVGEIRSTLLKAFVFTIVPVLLILIALIAFSHFEGLMNSENEVIRRLALIGQDSDDTLIARGYALVLNPDERLVFGYGEGFYNMLYGNEVHSTLANVLTSFGIVGFLLFLAMLLHVVQFRILSQHFGLVSLVLAYGLTHNGLRNTLFWVFLAIIAWSAEQAGLADKKNKLSITTLGPVAQRRVRA